MSLLLKNKIETITDSAASTYVFEFTFWYQIRKNRPKARKRVLLSKVRKKWGRVRKG